MTGSGFNKGWNAAGSHGDTIEAQAKLSSLITRAMPVFTARRSCFEKNHVSLIDKRGSPAQSYTSSINRGIFRRNSPLRYVPWFLCPISFFPNLAWLRNVLANVPRFRVFVIPSTGCVDADRRIMLLADQPECEEFAYVMEMMVFGSKSQPRRILSGIFRGGIPSPTPSCLGNSLRRVDSCPFRSVR